MKTNTAVAPVSSSVVNAKDFPTLSPGTASGSIGNSNTNSYNGGYNKKFNKNRNNNNNSSYANGGNKKYQEQRPAPTPVSPAPVTAKPPPVTTNTGYANAVRKASGQRPTNAAAAAGVAQIQDQMANKLKIDG